MTTANRGKLAEKKAKAFFSSLATSATTAFIRLPDAHAGSMVATLADYALLIDKRFVLAEVKSTLHDYRLPHGNFGADQVARMNVWQHAGATCLVLVYAEKLDGWRGLPLDYFKTRTGGSWDMRAEPIKGIKQAFWDVVYDVNSVK